MFASPWRRPAVSLLVAAVAASAVGAVPAFAASDDPLASPASFTSPPQSARPKSRWWWASPYDASATRYEVNAMADAGFGGGEIAYNADGWATPAQRDNLTAAMQTARDRNFDIDMTMGAAWPITTPATANGTGLSSQELQYGRADVAGGSTYSGLVPRPYDEVTTTLAASAAPGATTITLARGTGFAVGNTVLLGGTETRTIAAVSGNALTLTEPLTGTFASGASVRNTRDSRIVAVTAARVISRGPAVAAPADPTANPRFPGTAGNTLPPSSSTILDPTSLTDLTGSLSDGSLNWTAPEGDWIVFAFWARDTRQNVMSLFDSQSVTAAGAYIDANQVGAANDALLGQVGGSFFEDSLELEAQSIYWAPRMANEFASRRGYPMAKYLPLMFAQGMSRYWVPEVEPTPDFDLPGSQGKRVRHDYYQTLTDLYVDDHLKPFQEWASKRGMQYRTQAAYGQDLDATRSARELTRAGGLADEESYNAGDFWPPFDTTANGGVWWRFAMDHYRSVTGGVHQAGKTRVGTEIMAGRFLGQSKITFNEYKTVMDKEWSAGVTQPILHGYSMDTAGSQWPGTQRFPNSHNENWNARTFPMWSMFKPFTDYWARGTKILESGKARTDVAIYRDGFLTTEATVAFDVSAAPFFDSLGLEKAGYRFEYLDPAGVVEPQARGKGMLYPDTTQYRALIVDERALPANVAETIADEAEQGLGVVLVGSLPDADTSYRSTTDDDARVRAAVARIVASPHTRRVATQADAVTALAALDVQPDAKWLTPTQVDSQHRETADGDYYYLNNPTPDAVSFEASFKASGKPYLLDAWTGKITPIATYRIDGDRVIVPIKLDATDSLFLGFRKHDDSGTSVIATDSQDVAVDGGHFEVRDTRPGTRSVTFTGGAVGHATIPALPAPITATSWKLHVQEVGPESPQPTHDLQVDNLPDWRDVDAIELASGFGTYTSTVTLPAGWTAGDRGTYLDLGTVDGGSVQVYVNGTLATPNVNRVRRVDVSSLVHDGANEIRVEFASTVRNKRIALYGRINDTTTQSYGLRGPVTLTPFGRAVATLASDVPVDVGGTVPATLSLTLGAPAAFGAFTPGAAMDYFASTTASVTSTAGDALLSVSDPSTTATGHLVNGTFSLPQPLQARARNAANTGTAYNAVGSSSSPLNLLTWSAPISSDAVALEFKQSIGASDALRTGSYSKSLTFTVSTTTP